MSTADAVARETAWLTTAGDGLPALVASAGGPFDVVQAYAPRVTFEEKRTIYVLRRHLSQTRFAGQRLMARHHLRLLCWWPVLDVTGSAENEQAAFDAAIDLLYQRITGPLGNKTHGGRFLSVAEDGQAIECEMADPEQTIPESGALHAVVTYTADDPETAG